MTRDFSQGWGYAFLIANSRLYEKERQSVLRSAVDMFRENTLERKVRGQTFEGIISSKGEYKLLGSFGGQEFNAHLETDRGKIYISFLISEKLAEYMAVNEN